MLRRLSLVLIDVYQGYLRRLLPSSCRFSPSCSEYTKQAIEKYGFFRGAFKGLRRLVCCHPLSGRDSRDPLV